MAPCPETSATSGNSSLPIEEVLLQIADQVPIAEWQRLPADLSDRIDYYVYQNQLTESENRNA